MVEMGAGGWVKQQKEDYGGDGKKISGVWNGGGGGKDWAKEEETAQEKRVCKAEKLPLLLASAQPAAHSPPPPYNATAPAIFIASDLHVNEPIGPVAPRGSPNVGQKHQSEAGALSCSCLPVAFLSAPVGGQERGTWAAGVVRCRSINV